MSVPAKTEQLGALESVLAKGDLSKLSEPQRTDYYLKLCNSLGLNPLTQPFEYLTLNGKLVLYAKRACADQLRANRGITLTIVSQDQNDGLLTVHVRAKERDSGREDEDLGVVNFPDTLRGEARANAILKAVTKAKRRVTLSICGLGFLDETEVEDIPASAKQSKPHPSASVVRGEPSISMAGGYEYAQTRATPMAASENALAHDSGPSGPIPTHDPQTGAVNAPFAIHFDGNWISFGQKLIACATADHRLTQQWLDANRETMTQMMAGAPKVHQRMMAAIANKVSLAPPDPSPTDDPEEYLKWLRQACADMTSVEGLKALSASQDRVLAEAFPPDAEQASIIIGNRLKELADAGTSDGEAPGPV